MDSQQVIALFEEVGTISDQMLSAARNADWDRLTALESVCAHHIDALRRSPQPATLSSDCRVRKVQIIRKILADDRQIRDLVEPWMAELAANINSAGTERKLRGAYGSV